MRKLSLPPQSFLLLLSFNFIVFIIPGVPLSNSSLSFNYTDFSSGTSGLSLEGNAVLLDGFIDLSNGTSNPGPEHSVGRAAYSQPFQLYDNEGNQASFTTHFSFIIDSQNQTPYADGLAFFLAPNGTSLPSQDMEGCNLGLMSSEEQMSQTAGSFVAVEFDTYKNDWDPEYDHVGINLNFLKSIFHVKWSSRILEGRRSEAWISYNASTDSLDVKFSNFTGNGQTFELGHLHQTINLSQMLPEWVMFGLSASTGTYTELHKVLSWDFQATFPGERDNEVLNELPPPSEPPTPNHASLSKAARKSGSFAIWLSVGSGILLIVSLVTIGCINLRKKRRGNDDKVSFELPLPIDDEFGKGAGPRKFLYSELARATDDFDEEGKLGKGGFGCVYKGFLKDTGTSIAVKKVSKGSKQGLKEFASEVRIISQLRHRNLVQLIGWCHEKGELLLAYEFMPNGSLDQHLFKGTRSLSWSRRYDIARGLGSALLYLHELGNQCVLHRDIKSSNVMLDSDFNAKLGDFGLARLVDHSKGSQTTVLAGTLGYMAPECLTSGKASKESDVYSFGVVALEIACGRRSVEPKAEEELQLVNWVWELYGSGELLEAADSNLRGEYNKEEMECLMIVGLWCVHPDSTLRPSIREALKVLNFESPLPKLPLQMPVLRYVAPALDLKSLQNISFSTTISFPRPGQSLKLTDCTTSSEHTSLAALSPSPERQPPEQKHPLPTGLEHEGGRNCS